MPVGGGGGEDLEWKRGETSPKLTGLCALHLIWGVASGIVGLRNSSLCLPIRSLIIMQVITVAARGYYDC